MSYLIRSLMVLTLAAPASAQYVIDTGTPDPIENSSSIYYSTTQENGQFLARAFTITDTVTIRSVEVYLNPGTAILGSITDAIGVGTTVADELARFTIAASQNLEWSAGTTEVDLIAGTYYLVLWGEGNFSRSAPYNAPTDIGEGFYSGTSYLDRDFGPASTFFGSGIYDKEIAIRMSEVPEPATAGLFAAGLAGMLLRRRRA